MQRSILFTTPVGILSYGVAIPALSILHSEISSSSTASNMVLQKSVPELDQDTATLATQAAFQACTRFEHTALLLNQDMSRSSISSLFIGSESHPYAVKPTGTIVSAALGLSEYMSMANLEFACKAGTQALQIGLQYVSSSGGCSLAIGSDTAQSQPGDALEFTAGAGAAAFILGSEPANSIARVHGTCSYATDTPDFWRRNTESYPQHAGRFTGQPAYFKHSIASATQLLSDMKLVPSDVTYCVFHTPNGVFPQNVARTLGFTKEQLLPSLVVSSIGNTYSAASLLALSAVLDEAKPGDTILLTSYGSGAGSDSFFLEIPSKLRTQKKVLQYMKTWKDTGVKQLSAQMQAISYSQYRLHMDQHV